MRLAATCACLFLMPLAFMQGVSDCIVSKRAPCHNLFNFEIKDMPTPEKRLLIFNNHFDQLSNTEKICLLQKVLEFYMLVNEDVWTKELPEEHICVMHDLLVYFKDNCIKCEACQEIFKNTTQPMKKGCRGIFESRAKSTKKCYKVKENGKGKKNICRKVSQNEKQSNGTHCTKIKQSKKKVCKGMFGDKTQSRKCSNYKRNMDLNGTAIINCQLSRLKREKRKTPAKVQEKIFFELDILQGFLDSAERTVSREANHNGR
ncbi:uncharacterized protein [Aquarana catesbeiana]|uniref:uncharacterized protein isoform X1 n=2 Tax=Aquarana catesbeiana TaxID=8400 RepID=UPI003CC934A9